MSKQYPKFIDLPDMGKMIINRRLEVTKDKSLLVAISGIDGSGKGYITEKLVTDINDKGVNAISINIDAWLTIPEIRYNPENPGEHFYHYGFRFDDMFTMLIDPLRENRQINLTTELTGQFGIPVNQTYNFQDVDVILLEGIFLLKRELQVNYDLSFWIECSFETALKRALQRNQEGLPPELIVRDYEIIYFPAQRFHFAMDDPQSVVDGIYVNDV
jgi:uridine kinase